MLVGRNFGLDQPADKLIEFTLKIWEQDRVLIESQRPVALPLDLREELHLRGADAPSVVYRRMMNGASEESGA
jgi:vanillate O-demethylase monooxygenase subunit